MRRKRVFFAHGLTKKPGFRMKTHLVFHWYLYHKKLFLGRKFYSIKTV